jgi:hypothetical protein
MDWLGSEDLKEEEKVTAPIVIIAVHAPGRFQALARRSIEHARVPVLIGEGIPLFAVLARDIRLRHIASRHYSTGPVQSEYQTAA